MNKKKVMYLIKTTYTYKEDSTLYAEYFMGKGSRSEEETYCNSWFIEKYGYKTRKTAENAMKHWRDVFGDSDKYYNIAYEVVAMEC